MASSYDDVVREYGEKDLREPNPQPLVVPCFSPTFDEIYEQRLRAGFTQKEAAEACAVTVKTWQRWEDGKGKMPRLTWGWFKIMTGGASVAGGVEWEGWSFYKGRLYSPESRYFTAGEIRSWPYLQAQLSELKRENRELAMALERELKIRPPHVKALGQIDILGLVARHLICEYEKADDNRLQEFSYKLRDTMKELAIIRISMA